MRRTGQRGSWTAGAVVSRGGGAGGAGGIVDRRRGRESGRRAGVDEIAWVIEEFRTRYFDFTAKHLYGVISVKALVRIVLPRCLFEGRPCPRLDPGNAEAIGSALGRLSQVVVGTESIPRGARQQAQPIALAYLYSVGHATRTMIVSVPDRDVTHAPG